MFFRRRRKKKKTSVTCANSRGRTDRKCTVICCACVLSQTTSGCCHPIISPITCEIPLYTVPSPVLLCTTSRFLAGALLIGQLSAQPPLQKLWDRSSSPTLWYVFAAAITCVSAAMEPSRWTVNALEVGKGFSLFVVQLLYTTTIA